MYDRRNGVAKPVLRLATVGHERMFDVIAPGLCAPHITDDVLVQQALRAQNRTAHV